MFTISLLTKPHFRTYWKPISTATYEWIVLFLRHSNRRSVISFSCWWIFWIKQLVYYRLRWLDEKPALLQGPFLYLLAASRHKYFLFLCLETAFNWSFAIQFLIYLYITSFNYHLFIFASVYLSVFIPFLADARRSLIIRKLKPIFNGDIILELLVLSLFVLQVVELLPHYETLRTASIVLLMQFKIWLLTVLFLWRVKHHDAVLAVLSIELWILTVEALVEIVQHSHCNEHRDEAYERDYDFDEIFQFRLLISI